MRLDRIDRYRLTVDHFNDLRRLRNYRAGFKPFCLTLDMTVHWSYLPKVLGPLEEAGWGLLRGGQENVYFVIIHHS